MESSNSHPTRYRIIVKGRLSERFVSAFGGDLDVETRAAEGGRPAETEISGAFLDQAQLYGVLDGLRNLGIDLVSVNALD